MNTGFRYNLIQKLANLLGVQHKFVTYHFPDERAYKDTNGTIFRQIPLARTRDSFEVLFTAYPSAIQADGSEAIADSTLEYRMVIRGIPLLTLGQEKINQAIETQWDDLQKKAYLLDFTKLPSRKQESSLSYDYDNTYIAVDVSS